jgi:hypothetical protein
MINTPYEPYRYCDSRPYISPNVNRYCPAQHWVDICVLRVGYRWYDYLTKRGTLADILGVCYS